MAEILAWSSLAGLPSCSVPGDRRGRPAFTIQSRHCAELRSSVLGRCLRLGHGSLHGNAFPGRSTIVCGLVPDGSLVAGLVTHSSVEMLGHALQGSGVVVADVVADAIGNLRVEGIGEMLQDVGSAQVYGAVSSLQTGIADALQAFNGLPEGDRWRIGGISVGSWLYLTARPGVLSGAFDAYFFAPLQKFLDGIQGRRSWSRSDFVVGDRLGEGSFGTVYSGVLLPKGLQVDDELGRRGSRIEELPGYKSFQKVVLKKVKVGVVGAEECGEMEEWFNYRLRRAAPDACATFLGSFVADATRGQFTQGGKWLVWKFEGDSNLGEFMQLRDFPQNLGEAVFGRSLKEEDPLKRDALIIKKIFRQIVISLKQLHDTGIVHRDVKPSNVVVTNKGKLKFIDFGAATDLRVGKNYVPDRGMLDPDYCPPELFVLPERTPKPPPAPVAALLSPFIWQINSPDLFDLYSAGIILLLMASPNLRSSANLQVMKKELEAVDYDLQAWRRTTKLRPNFEILDLDGGQGWDLATKLVCKRGIFRRGRLSAASALRHPYFLLGRDQAASIMSKFTWAR